MTAIAPAPVKWITMDRLRPCPVDPAAMVMIRYRNGRVYGPLKAGTRRWDRLRDQLEPMDWDIVAYALVPDERKAA